MVLSNNTILITGGSSGIGLELAGVLIQKGNTVIICGRSEDKLKQARQQYPELHIFKCDISVRKEREKLYGWVRAHYPECNILINNAAVTHKANFYAERQAMEKATYEVETNFLAPLALTKLFLPLLEQHKNAKLIYITTGLVYTPRTVYLTYCATKAALHSFIQTLRVQLAQVPVGIIEVLMPAVDTPFHEGDPPKIAISVEKAVEETVRKIEKGQTEIKVAGTKILYFLARLAPSIAFRKINGL